ncbi:MAG: hypothetical protein AAF865_13985 [Pseudomonadota bacterium]
MWKGVSTALALSALAGPGMAADYMLSIVDKGLREYYCQITVTLENTTDEELIEISGFFYSFVGEEEVGRSKGAWFMNVPAGEMATATFETPNAPCDKVETYQFIVGACRFGPSFADKSECAARIGGAGIINAVAGS